MPNASLQLLPKAGAGDERALEAVSCKALFGPVTANMTQRLVHMRFCGTIFLYLRWPYADPLPHGCQGAVPPGLQPPGQSRFRIGRDDRAILCGVFAGGLASIHHLERSRAGPVRRDVGHESPDLRWR